MIEGLFINGNGWLIVGLVLVIVEMLLNLGYVSISFGLGAMLTGLLIKLEWVPAFFGAGFVDELLIGGILSVIALVVLRLIFNKKADVDINNY